MLQSLFRPVLRPIMMGVMAVTGSRRAWSPLALFAASEKGCLYDFTQLANLYQDSVGTTPCTAVGDPIGLVLDTSGNGNHASQATPTKRPILGRMPATGVRNLLVNTATLSTQNVTTSAGAYTIQFTGAGSVTASGTYSGALTNGQTFTCTAGTLTLTVSGSVTAAQLEEGSTATAKQVVGEAYDVTEAGVASVYTAYFDGIDDELWSPTIDWAGSTKLTHFSGALCMSTGNYGGFYGNGAANDVGTPGRFGISLPVASGANARIDFGGVSDAILGDITIPKNSSSIFSVALDSVTNPRMLAKRNGVVAFTSNTDVGGQPFATASLGVGTPYSNGGSSGFNGFFSLLCVRGAASTADEISDMEAYMVPKTPGVTLP